MGDPQGFIAQIVPFVGYLAFSVTTEAAPRSRQPTGFSYLCHPASSRLCWRGIASTSCWSELAPWGDPSRQHARGLGAGWDAAPDTSVGARPRHLRR
jgi:hypothetical protein